MQLGVDPGAPDGTFDSETRQAIRIYQRDQGLQPTGYLDQETVVRCSPMASSGADRRLCRPQATRAKRQRPPRGVAFQL